jgi:predicted SnoaL-like aldol condensation-catalyzing enzyme
MTIPGSRVGDGAADRRQQVMALLKSIETGATGPLGIVDARAYKQHNLGAEDGVEGFVKLLQRMPRGSAKVHTVRVFDDGEYVVAHSDYDFFGPKVGFDIFRFQDGGSSSTGTTCRRSRVPQIPAATRCWMAPPLSPTWR